MKSEDWTKNPLPDFAFAVDGVIFEPTGFATASHSQKVEGGLLEIYRSQQTLDHGCRRLGETLCKQSSLGCASTDTLDVQYTAGSTSEHCKLISSPVFYKVFWKLENVVYSCIYIYIGLQYVTLLLVDHQTFTLLPKVSGNPFTEAGNSTVRVGILKHQAMTSFNWLQRLETVRIWWRWFSQHSERSKKLRRRP